MRSSVLLSSLAILGYVSSQGVFEVHHMHNIAHKPTIGSIPSEFVITDINPVKEFEKYTNQIHNLATRENVTVVYRINVDVLKKLKTINYEKKYLKKIKAKKFNIPLKKNSMKLSNFEAFLRKAAEDNNHHQQKSGGTVNFDRMPVSTNEPLLTTKIPIMKYKPVLSKLNKFAKVIRPVKNRIITLS